MYREQSEYPRGRGVRDGLKMLAGAVLLVPLLFLLEGLVPSIENSTVDELPRTLVALAAGILALAGIVRIAYAVVVHPPEHRLRDSESLGQLDAPRPRDMRAAPSVDTPVRVRRAFDTPV